MAVQEPRRRKPAYYTPHRRQRKKAPLNIYKIVVIAILIFGGIVICHKMYQLWEIHMDMVKTVQQKETLLEEQQRLQEEKNRLNDPDSVTEEAREQFGLVKNGEIPYKR